MGHMSDTINIGAADIYWYPAETNIPIWLGLTKDGVTVKYETDWHELTADQSGTTPLDDVQIGEKATAEFNLLDTSKRKIASTIPLASIEGSKESPEAVTFGRFPGFRATHKSGKLRIHPISMGQTDMSYDIIIYRTCNTGSLELALKLDAEWIIPCVFKAYYDDYRKPGDRLFRIGKESVESNKEHGYVKSFWISPNDSSVEKGKTIAFHANTMLEDGTNVDVTSECTWTSSDTSIITISQNTGEAQAVSEGNAIIDAQHKDYENLSCMTSIGVIKGNSKTLSARSTKKAAEDEKI